jgi:hypothetical protein
VRISDEHLTHFFISTLPHFIHDNLSPPTIDGLPHKTTAIGFEEVGLTLGVFFAGTGSVSIFFTSESGRIEELTFFGDEDIQVVAPLDDSTSMIPEIFGIIGIHLSCPEEQVATAICATVHWVADTSEFKCPTINDPKFTQHYHQTGKSGIKMWSTYHSRRKRRTTASVPKKNTVMKSISAFSFLRMLIFPNILLPLLELYSFCRNRLNAL